MSKGKLFSNDTTQISIDITGLFYVEDVYDPGNINREQINNFNNCPENIIQTITTFNPHICFRTARFHCSKISKCNSILSADFILLTNLISGPFDDFRHVDLTNGLTLNINRGETRSLLSGSLMLEGEEDKNMSASFKNIVVKSIQI